MKHFLLLSTFLIAALTSSAQTLVKDIYPGHSGGYPINFVTMGGYTYFVASDSTHGFELWKTDGTEVGTTIVKDVAPGTDDGLAEDEDGLAYSTILVLNNELYFYANDDSTGYELWKSDGTEAGTTQVKDIWPNEKNSADLGLPMVLFNNTLYFTAEDTEDHYQLWKSDGTTSGTTVVRNINADRSAFPAGFFVNGNTMYFEADTGFLGGTLWKTDGTADGTQLLIDLDTINYNGYASNFVTYNNKVYFTAYEPAHGGELWTTDGTPAGTKLALDIAPGPFGSNPQSTIVLGNKMIFAADSLYTGNELWVSDGTPQGTYMLKDINPALNQSSYPYYLTKLGDKLFFEADDGINGQELWSTDGTTNGTSMVKNINTQTATAPSNPDKFAVANGKLYFTVDDGIHGREPWQTDGTIDGTMLIGDICPGNDCWSDAFGFTGNGNMVLFNAYNDITGTELYRIGEPTGINEVNTPIDFSIHPNPAKNYVTVITDKDAVGGKVQLLDITGSEFMATTLETSVYQMNTSALPAGVYLIKVNNAKGEQGVKKVIIE